MVMLSQKTARAPYNQTKNTGHYWRKNVKQEVKHS